MRSMNDSESPSRRGLILLLGPLVVGAMLVAALLVRSTERPLPVPRVAAKKPPVAESAAPPVQETYVPPPVVPEKRSSEAEVARAMDLSNIRMIVRAIAEAAATENKSRERSMLRALERYGADARPIIAEALTTINNTQAQEALRQALARAQ